MDTLEPSAPIALTEDAILQLRSTRKWAFFLAIIGFIGSAFMMLFGVFFAFTMRLVPMEEEVSRLPGMLVSILYFIFGVIYIFPAVFLLNYANKLKRSLAMRDGEVLTQAFKHLRYLFSFFGILTIVGIAVTIIVVLIGIGVAVFAAMNEAA